MKVRFALAGIAAAALGVATIASLPTAYAGGGGKGGMMHSDKKDIIDTAVGPGMQEVTTVVTAIKAAGLVDTLKGPGPFTVFAPTNDAFKKLPPGTVEDLLKPENKDKLVAILTYHVHAGDAIMADDVKTMNLSTVEGAPLMVKTSGRRVDQQCQGHQDRRGVQQRRDPLDRHRRHAAGEVIPMAGESAACGVTPQAAKFYLLRQGRTMTYRFARGWAKSVTIAAATILTLAGCEAGDTGGVQSPAPATTSPSTQPAGSDDIGRIEKTDAEWKKALTPDQYYILRAEGTEPPFHNEFFDNHQKGTYICAGCALELFSRQQVRIRNRLAELLSDDRAGSRCDWQGRRRRARRSHLPALRRPPGPRFRRRSEADRQAILHRQRRIEIRAGEVSRGTGVIRFDGCVRRKSKQLGWRQTSRTAG